MPGPCEQCVHHRPERKPAHLLGLAWTLETADQITRNQDFERQVHVNENRMKRQLMEVGQCAWPRRPQVLAYCGLREAEEIHYIREMKNRGGICPDFRPADGRDARLLYPRPSVPRGSF